MDDDVDVDGDGDDNNGGDEDDDDNDDGGQTNEYANFGKYMNVSHTCVLKCKYTAIAATSHKCATVY